MAIVRNIIRDALFEIGVQSMGEDIPPENAEIGLLRLQNQLDSWQADRLTLSIQPAISISWPSSTSTQTIGPGGDIVEQRPVWINSMNYVIPGSSPAVESYMGQLDPDQYAQLTIKALQSALPQQFFYQTSIDSVLGTIFIWPQPTQTITLKMYTPQAVGVPATLDSILLGPPGYQEAFMYQLALRLYTPFWGPKAEVPQLLVKNAKDATANMKRPNVDPGLLGVDPALIPSVAGGYNILTDNSSAPSVR